MKNRRLSGYRTRLVRYTTMGCPGLQFEDVCENPEKCADDGCCERIRMQNKLKEVLDGDS